MNEWRSNSSTYHVWEGMKQRCLNPRAKDFARYGGRGVTLCPRWHFFANFVTDMGERPDGMSLDRVDNNKGYCKSNCKWSTPSEQQRNRRVNALITIGHETKCLVEWAETFGLCYSTLKTRIRRGWDPVEAVTTATGKSTNG